MDASWKPTGGNGRGQSVQKINFFIDTNLLDVNSTRARDAMDLDPNEENEGILFGHQGENVLLQRLLLECFQEWRIVRIRLSNCRTS